MDQDVGRAGQKLIARGQLPRNLLFKHIQVNVSENAVLSHRNKGINNRIGEDVTIHLGVISNVGNKFVVRHDQDTTIVTLPTPPTPWTKPCAGNGCMFVRLIVLNPEPIL